jgi:hypothetical protein
MNRFGLIFLSCFAVGISLTTAGCGDDDDDASGGINPQTPCEEMVYAICEAACECSEDCAWSADAVSSSSSDLETCYNMELAWGTCDEVEMDFDACKASISQDQCVEGPLGLRLELEEPCWDLSGW